MVDVKSHFHSFTSPFYPIFIYQQHVLYDYAQIFYYHVMEYCKLINIICHQLFLVNEGYHYLMFMKYFQRHPFLQHYLHIFTHVTTIEGITFYTFHIF
jgi:hypothetical protein